MTRCRTSRCCQSASCSSDRYSYASQQRQLQRQRRSMKSKLAPWQLRVSVRDTRPGDKISKITCTSPRMKTKARTPEAHPGHTLVPASNSGARHPKRRKDGANERNVPRASRKTSLQPQISDARVREARCCFRSPDARPEAPSRPRLKGTTRDTIAVFHVTSSTNRFAVRHTTSWWGQNNVDNQLGEAQRDERRVAGQRSAAHRPTVPAGKKNLPC